MAQGLITRIGLWIDSKFEDKVTLSQLVDMAKEINAKGENLANEITLGFKALPEFYVDKKDLNELKTRIEKLELYSGLTRRVDPTKPPVEKSAFQM
jgi:hypothetical protein